MQSHNYRVEFYGGPNDGHVTYVKLKPEDVYECVISYVLDGDVGIEVMAYYYNAKVVNEYIVNYMYDRYSLVV